MELAVVLPPLVLIVLSAIDLGRMARFQNQLTNAAREGAAIAQYHPGWVGPGGFVDSDGDAVDERCSGTQGRNIIDRATKQNAELAAKPDFKVTAREVGGADFAHGCTNTMPSGVVPGDRIEVSVEARFGTVAPLTRLIWGSSVLLSRSAEVEVAGG